MNKFYLLILILSMSLFNFSYSSHVKTRVKQQPLTEQEKLDHDLFKSSKSGDLKAVQKLISQGANPDGFKDKFEATSLYVVAQQTYAKATLTKQEIENYQNIAELLIKSGANVNFKNKHGYPILFYALSSGSQIELYNLLIKNGANINIQNSPGRTALMFLLIDSTTNINSPEAVTKDIILFRINDLPKFINIILFRTNFEYNLDILDNNGFSVYDYANHLPDESKNWVLASLDSFKLLKEMRTKHINECLNKEILPDLSSVVQQYLGETRTLSKQTEQKETEEQTT